MLYIAFLRGINVGGHQVKMERLREIFTEVGLNNVRSYINSGNIFFETDQKDLKALNDRFEKDLEAALGYAAPVFLRKADQLKFLLNSDPFANTETNTDVRLCLMFTKQKIEGELKLPLISPKHDVEVVKANDNELFLIWHIIDGRPPNASAFLDPISGKVTTTRFFHTLRKILAAAEKELKS